MIVTQIQLANDAAADAATALRLDPHNDYAHHLMGRYDIVEATRVIWRCKELFLYPELCLCY
jgi:hypothetical protein